MVDSGASMHVVSRKDLNSAELETVKVPKSPTTVVTANGEVLTKEEATVYVRELDLFVTVMLLEGNTQAVLSLGNLCEDHGYNYHWTSGQKPHLIKNGRKIDCNTANYVPFVVLGLSTSSSSPSSPTSPTSSSCETVTPTEHPASTRSESMSEEVRGNSSHDLPEWLEEIKDNPQMNVFLNTETLPVLLMNYRQSREQKWYRVNTTFFTHFPKDRICNICCRAKITRDSYRKRTGTVVPRAEQCGDLTTVGHKVLVEGRL